MNILEQKVAQKSHIIYSCEFCDYNTSKKNDFNKHLLTRKHQKNSVLEHFEQKKSQKSPTIYVVYVGNNIYVKKWVMVS